MNIQKIQNNKHTPSFGTYLGIHMQEKVLLAKQRNAFSKEQLANLERIEENGLDAFLDIANKYVIQSVNKKQGVMKQKKVLRLTDNINSVDIADISHVFQSFGSNNNKLVFRLHDFIKIFRDDFNLPQKVEQAWEKLSSNKS